MNRAKGSRKLAISSSKLTSWIPIFANNQMTRPAGAATQIALPKTNKVRSKRERIKIFPNWGLRKGGNSNTKEEGSPFKMVFEKRLEMAKVKKIPNKITKITARVENSDAPKSLHVPSYKYGRNSNEKRKSSDYKEQSY